MTRRMLINAQRPEELRIAIITGPHLDRYEVAAAESGLMRGNIYRGVVASINPSLGAAFVEIGAERHGLLKGDDIVAAACHRKPEDGDRRRMERCLEKGRPVVVQVTRDAVGTKGCVLTTDVSLAGRYLVMMPLDPVRGVSRKVDDGETRQTMRDLLAKLNVPEGVGVIVRTNAADQPKATLNRDLSALQRLWKRIRSEANKGKGPRLLYSDQDLIVQALRDFLDSDIEEVLVDTDEAHAKVADYMRAFMPRSKTRLVRYADRMPLFSRFNLEEQIDRIYQRTVELPSGGSIVIDGTEALTAIDVNSGRGSRGKDQEEMIKNTNLEAAREVARQLRLRDIGGLVVVDFIDMRPAKNRKAVEKALRDAMKDDKARSSVGRISANGLLEINRQRVKKALQLRTHRTCPTCMGAGTIASPELVGLNLLRRIETRAVDGLIGGARISLHPELADAFQNHRRQELAALEREFELKIEVIAATHLHRSEEEVEWLPREARKAPPPEVATPALSAADLSSERGGGRSEARSASRGGDGGAQKPGEAKDKGGEADARGAEDKPASGRRRSRSGRRRKKPADGDGAGAGDASQDTAEEVSGGSGETTGENEDSGEAKPATRKRRRRGGRRHKKTTSNAEVAPLQGERARPSAPEQAAAETGGTQTGGEDGIHAGGDGADADSDRGTGSRRRRRRPRRRRSGGASPEGGGE